jgi:tRNA(Phe) wybutosine-synthesizing methylase Tyw3
MDNADNRAPAETPDAETYFGLTEEEKEIELQKSIMRMHDLIYKISRYDTGSGCSGKK